MDRLIARNGGTFNGFTSHDYTAYFETLPADRIELGLQIESDRMVNSLFDPDEVESERTVIISEREGHENDPEWWLSEALMAAAFQFHPYRNEVIGWKSDLRAITRDELYAHYQTYYMPNNAVLVLVGDFQTDAIMRQVEQYFAGLPSGPALPAFRARGAGAAGRAAGGRFAGLARRSMCRSATIRRTAATPTSRRWCCSTRCFRARRRWVSAAARRPIAARGSTARWSRRSWPPMPAAATAPARDPYLFDLDATVQEGHTAAEIEAALLPRDRENSAGWRRRRLRWPK